MKNNNVDFIFVNDTVLIVLYKEYKILLRNCDNNKFSFYK